MKSEREIREDVATVCRMMWQKGYVAASDGNVSVRLGRDRVLCTPSGISKGLVGPRDLVVTDMSGKKLLGRMAVTSEIRLHLEVYRKRDDVHGVVHAHPPIATAFSIAGMSLAQCVIPEVVMTMGSIPTSRYATPCTAEGPEVISDLITKCDALLLDRHGSLTVGKDVLSAYLKLEKVEHCAHVTMAARQLGNIKTLSPEQVNRLIAMRGELGLSGRVIECNKCGTCQTGQDVTVDGDLISSLVEEAVRSLAPDGTGGRK